MSMKFSEYFELWANQNYYKNGVKIGKNGDFYTAVSVGSMFGITLAKHFISLVKNGEIKPECDIVEIGANDGSMMVDFIQGVFSFDKDMLKNLTFHIIEPHENLKQLQKTKFKTSFTSEINVFHHSSLKECSFENAFFMCNELLDTFACEIIKDDKMLFIKNEKPVFEKMDEKTKSLASKFNITNGELPINLENFVQEIYKCAKKCWFLTADYGYTINEQRITLRIYKNHEVYNFFEISNLKDFFGISDITYDVNFSLLKNIFEKNGFKMVKFQKQGNALLDFGIMDLVSEIEQKAGFNAYQNAISQIKHLIDPRVMGEKFKIIEFKKG